MAAARTAAAHLALARLHELLPRAGRLGVAEEGREVRRGHLGRPLALLKAALVDQLHCERTHKRGRRLRHVLRPRRRQLLAHPLRRGAPHGRDLRRVLLDALQRLQRFPRNRPNLRVCDLLARALHQRHDGREEGRGVHGVVDELGHVVGDEARLARDRLHTVLQAAVEQRNNDREVRPLDRLHEGGGREAVDAVRDLGGLGHRLDEPRHKGLDVVVACRA